jgi:NitT/TauT family transport system substrate-binding protein
MSFFKLKTIVALSAALLTVGCNKTEMTSQAQGGSQMKIRVGYIGITCEAPIFCAIENGFFKEEGLEVELVKCEWSKYKDVLALGGFDITHHLIMYLLKPIEQGLDVKFTAGIHRGCLRIQSTTDGKIKTAQDLRGKRIGVPGMGTPAVHLCQSSSDC